MTNRTFDARPDRLDIRDRPYRPPLVGLPDCSPSQDQIQKHFSNYHKTGKVLNQGSEGACTGFGLAAVINFIRWSQWLHTHQEPSNRSTSPDHVSPWMLYEVAKIYDEWDGEDYSGSSCRGAMRGWHYHGVCQEALWVKGQRPSEKWSQDAAQRPLGAYYRINAKSISDMQAAIHETYAIYCSARVHEGWDLAHNPATEKITGLSLPIIPRTTTMTGGHAFALVGYTADGFIVQNSWGTRWGRDGFALLPYEDWVRNGDDAWVAAMGAPTLVARGTNVPESFSDRPMLAMLSGSQAGVTGGTGPARKWSMDETHAHAVVFGNDGKPLRRLIGTLNAADNIRKVALENPSAALRAKRVRDIVIYAHGGLNGESEGIARASIMGPWFAANGIHPIFLVWKTSFMETLQYIIEDYDKGSDIRANRLRAEGLFDVFGRITDAAKEAFDRSFESLAEKVIGKSTWTQMKQNAEYASKAGGGALQLVKMLKKLQEDHPDVRIHLVGHSAGANLLGHMLPHMKGLSLGSVTLYAPACSVDFAIRYYAKAMADGTIASQTMHVDILSDENERDDTVGPYGKSLLYLVSRSFETPRKMPLLGLEKCWDPTAENSLKHYFSDARLKDIKTWKKTTADNGVSWRVIKAKQVVTRADGPSPKFIDALHGCFDNNLETVNATISRIIKTKNPKKKVTDLTGF